MSVEWNEPGVVKDVGRLIHEGGKGWAACPAIAQALPDELGQLADQPTLLADVIQRVFEIALDADVELAKETNQYVRAARVALGWTSASYEEVYDIVHGSSEYLNEGPKLTAEADRQKHRAHLLSLMTVRFILAGLQLDKPIGSKRWFVDDGYLDRTVDAVVNALRTILCGDMRTHLDNDPKLRDLLRLGGVDLHSRPALNSANFRLSVKNPQYVDRLEIREQFQTLVSEEHKLIALVGQSGMGKSWIAKEITRTDDGTEAPSIRVTDGAINATDLRGWLQEYGIDVKGPIGRDAPEYLASLLNAHSFPPVVLLDNLDSTDELNELLPSRTKSLVVATCRRIGGAHPARCQVLDIGKMRTPEATKMVMRRLPKLNEADAYLLALSLHGYPLVIDYACALLDQRQVPVGQFVRELRADIKLHAASATTEEGASLLAVLESSIAMIHTRDPLAVQILTILCFASRNVAVVPELFLRFCLYTQEPISAARYMRAVQTLQQFRLVTIENLSQVSSTVGEGLSIHDITRLIVRQMYGAESVATAKQFMAAFLTIYFYLTEHRESEIGYSRNDLHNVGGRIVVCASELFGTMLKLPHDQQQWSDEERIIAQDLFQIVLEHEEVHGPIEEMSFAALNR